MRLLELLLGLNLSMLLNRDYVPGPRTSLSAADVCLVLSSVVFILFTHQ